MSKPIKLLVMVVINVLVLSVLAWQYIRLSPGSPGTSGGAREPTMEQWAMSNADADATPPAPRWEEMQGHDVPGARRWEGVWYARPDRPAGPLFAIAYPDGDSGQWLATFAGYWGKFLKYQVQTPGRLEDQVVRFQGPVNLGSPNEQYQWSASMTEAVFEGTYVHEKSKQTGGFRLTLVPPTPTAAPTTAPTIASTTAPAEPPTPAIE